MMLVWLRWCCLYDRRIRAREQKNPPAWAGFEVQSLLFRKAKRPTLWSVAALLRLFREQVKRHGLLISISTET
jgi:hypothetical protein